MVGVKKVLLWEVRLESQLGYEIESNASAATKVKVAADIWLCWTKRSKKIADRL